MIQWIRHLWYKNLCNVERENLTPQLSSDVHKCSGNMCPPINLKHTHTNTHKLNDNNNFNVPVYKGVLLNLEQITP